MLRTATVFVVGMVMGIVVLASLTWALLHLPQYSRIYAYYATNALTGGTVGLFVGFLQKRMAGLVAIICLVPPVFLQYGNRFSQAASGMRLVLLLVGSGVEMLMAFIVAHLYSNSRLRSRAE